MNAKMILVSAFLSFMYVSQSQTKVLKAIGIGHEIPDLELSNMRNFPKSKANLSDFKGKMLILDFWNKGCGSCIRMFPKMEHFQNLFKDQIQVLLVAKNTAKEVEVLFKNSPIMKSTNLPFVLGDTLLHGYFNINVNPFYVILDSSRRVIGITRQESMTKENIQAMLEGKKLEYVTTDLMDFDPSKSIFLEGNGRQQKFLKYYSALAGYIEGYDHGMSGSVIDSISGKKIGMKAVNLPIPNLYFMAYASSFDNYLSHGNYKVLVETHNQSKFFPPNDPSKLIKWKLSNHYTYEIVLPSTELINENKYMQSDLDRFFMLKSRIVDSLIDCLILYRTSDKDKIKTKGGFQAVNERTKDGTLINKNVPVSCIAQNLRNALSRLEDPPVLDEIEYSGNVDMILHTEFKDIDEVSKEFRKYDLAIKKEKRLVRCLILTEK